MPQLKTHSALTALVYGAGTDPGPLMRRIAGHLGVEGLRRAGFIQRDVPRPGRTQCDMVLEDISSGRAIPISEDRGPGARGCRIDEAELLSAMISALGQLQAKPDILIINKFGKTEAEGRGFRPLIAEAVEQGVPVLIAVPWRNVESWRLFAGELSQEHVLDGILGTDDEICRLLGLNTVPAEATTAVARESPAKRN